MSAQSLALALRRLPGVPRLFEAWYHLGTLAFTALARAAGAGVVRAVYLRRGGGRGDLLPGASDLDFFLVLETLPAQREMEFLKTFWQRYYSLRRLFPFWGEVLMGEEAELRAWLEIPTVRSVEAQYSWRLLWGRDCFAGLAPATRPDARDVFSEALKHYGDLLQPLLKLPDSQFHAGLAPHSPGAVKLRHGAKAAVDLFRLHHSRSLAPAARAGFWRLPRHAALRELPSETYGSAAAEAAGLLALQAPLFPETDPFTLFSELAHRALLCLHELAENLPWEAEESETNWRVSYKSNAGADAYSLSVRELFAERLLLRHPSLLARAVLAESTTQLYFTLAAPPDLDSFRDLIFDLRDVNFSFDRFSLAMPLTELAYKEMARTSLLDTPFHSFGPHRELTPTTAGAVETRPLPPATTPLPPSVLRKTFAELSFALRLPPHELEHFLEKMVALVLSLRVAAGHRELTTGFPQALDRFGARYPDRLVHLQSVLGPYLPGQGQEKIWSDLFARLDSLEDSNQAKGLRHQLEGLRRANSALPLSPTAPTDAWINLTPFLRMEMNAMREYYSPHRSALKL